MNISGIDMVSKSCAKHFSNTQETEASKIVLLQTIGQPIPGILLGGWHIFEPAGFARLCRNHVVLCAVYISALHQQDAPASDFRDRP